MSAYQMHIKAATIVFNCYNKTNLFVDLHFDAFYVLVALIFYLRIIKTSIIKTGRTINH